MIQLTSRMSVRIRLNDLSAEGAFGEDIEDLPKGLSNAVDQLLQELLAIVLVLMHVPVSTGCATVLDHRTVPRGELSV
jgi:hypothetical protein